MTVWRLFLLALFDVAITAIIARGLAWFVFKREASVTRQRAEMLALARYSDQIGPRGGVQ